MYTFKATKFTKSKAFAVKFATPALMSVLIILLSLTAKSQKNNDAPGIFYAITGNGIKDTSWLFGTYHLVNSSYLTETPAVQQAFNKAEGLVVEIEMDSAKMFAAAAMGTLKDKTLSDLLDKPFSDSLENELKTTLGVGIAQLNQLKPVNVLLTLSIVHLMKENNSQLKRYTGAPLDMYFVNAGKAAAKNITALETLEEQMEILFNKTSNEEQVNQLKLFLRNKKEMITDGNELLKNWFDHDLNKMSAVSKRSLPVFGSEEIFLKNRNNNWLKTLPGLLTREPQFIAVGALHLAGPDGLVYQLRHRGFTVTPIKP